MADNYWKNLGLAKAPFHNTKDNYFSLEQREKHLELLQYFTSYGSSLLVVSGPKGSGKTTLMQRLLQQTEDELRVCQLDGDNEISPSYLISALAKTFAVNQVDLEGVNTQQQAQQLLTQLQNHQQKCLLVIDDAQDLPLATLALLLQIVQLQGDQSILSIALFSEPQLNLSLVLAQQNMDDNLVHTIVLEPLSQEQTREYIQHQLQASGADNLDIPASLLDRIHKVSKGLPGLINSVSSKALEQLATQPRATASLARALPAMNKNVLIGGVATVLILGVAFTSYSLLQNKHGNQPMEQIVALPQEQQAASQQFQGPELTTVNLSQTQSTNELAQNSTPTQQKQQVIAAAQSPTGMMGSGDSVALQTSQLPAQPTTQTPTPTSHASPYDMMDDEADMPSTDQAPAPMPQAATPTEPAAVAVEPTIQPKPAASTVKPVTQPEPAAQTKTTKPVAKNTVKTPTQVTKFPVAANKNSYTIQILGSQSKQNIQSYIERNQLHGKTTVLTTRRNGQPWYVLVYGEYKTADQAKKGLAGLPESVRKNNPWVRQYSSITAERRNA